MTAGLLQAKAAVFSGRMDLSICILTHCQPDLLPKCVASCFAEINRAGISGEVIVIDNASIDGSPRRLSETFPSIRLIRNDQNLSFSTANNKAIRVSRGRHVLILNDDAVLEDGCLEPMLRKLEEEPETGVVGPMLVNPDGSVQAGFTNKRFPTIHGVLIEFLPFCKLFFRNRLTLFLTDGKDAGRSGEADHLAGACLLARRAALDAVGLFDDGFQYWFEDVDLCYRLKKAGWRVVYLAEVQVLHYGSASFRKVGGRPEQAATYYTSLVRLFRKNSSPARYNTFRAFMIPAFICRIPLAALYGILKRGPRLAEVSGALRTSWVVIRSMFARDGLSASGSGTTSEAASSGK